MTPNCLVNKVYSSHIVKKRFLNIALPLSNNKPSDYDQDPSHLSESHIPDLKTKGLKLFPYHDLYQRVPKLELLI